MSFPTAAHLNSVPKLADWLRESGWLKGSDWTGIQSNGIRVESISIEEPDDEDVACFNVRTIDSMETVNETTLTIFEDYNSKTRRVELDHVDDCDCPKGFACEHALAGFERLQSIVIGAAVIPRSSSARQKEIAEWLLKLKTVTNQKPETAKPPPKPYNKFLAYCIEYQEQYHYYGDPGFHLVLRVGTRNKNSVRIEKSSVRIDLNNPRKYMAKEDLPICVQIEAMRRHRNRWGQDIKIRGGEEWTPLLDAMLATGRMFVSTPEYDDEPEIANFIPLETGPILNVEPGWRKVDGFQSVPVLQFPDDSDDCELLETDPIRYLDRTNGRIGFVQSSVPASVLRTWDEGPVIAGDVLDAVAKGIASLSGNVVLPTPDDKPPVHHRGLKPQPVLTISEVRTGIYQKSHLGGLVRFRYLDREFLPLEADAPPEAMWYQNGERHILERDAATEAKLARSLAAHGLVPLRELFQPGDLNDKNKYSVVLGTPSTELRPWLEFMESPAAKTLEEAGWIINADNALNLTIHDIGDFFPEIETDDSHGIDWFRFDVTGEFDGKKISLIPHIARAIREDWPATYADPATRPEKLLLPCDDPRQGHIRFPAERFLSMVEQVRHLFHGTSDPDGPMKMDRLQAAGVADTLGLNVSETTRALAALGRNLRDIHGIPPVEVPATIKAELRPYQIDGFRWLQFLARHSLHGVLADDMGLGKTLQTLAHLAAETERADGRPSLVIAPTSVVPNWAAEAEKFAPTLRTLVLHGSDRDDHFEDIPKNDIVFTTYPLLARDFDILRKQDWHTIVLDEAQYIKNPKAISTQCACKLRAVHRICLSGTPMENHLGELWSLMRFLMPGFLADEKTFNATIRKPIERDRSQDAQLALNRRVSPLILRRTKDQVATELPEKTILTHHIDLHGKQTDLYESVRAAMDVRVRQAIAEKGLHKSHIIVLDALLKLRQICCHPQLLKSEAAQRVTESAKLEFLSQELLPTLLEEGRRILLFSQFTSMLELIEEHLQLEDIPYLKLTGQTKERAKLVKSFQSGEAPVFLISLKAGGTGLNLTAADTVIHYDPWWNPAVENQATDRAHRIGQKKPVFVHKLVCSGTIEERILELQKHKSALVEALLAEETTKLKIDATTLSHLFSPIGNAST